MILMAIRYLVFLNLRNSIFMKNSIYRLELHLSCDNISQKAVERFPEDSFVLKGTLKIHNKMLQNPLMQ